MVKMQKKSINNPEETCNFPRGKVELVTIVGITLLIWA